MLEDPAINDLNIDTFNDSNIDNLPKISTTVSNSTSQGELLRKDLAIVGIGIILIIICYGFINLLIKKKFKNDRRASISYRPVTNQDTETMESSGDSSTLNIGVFEFLEMGTSKITETENLE